MIKDEKNFSLNLILSYILNYFYHFQPFLYYKKCARLKEVIRLNFDQCDENPPKKSTRIHLKNVHENSPQKRTSCGQKCPREVTKRVHEKSPLLSTRSHLLCPRDICHPISLYVNISSAKVGMYRQDRQCRGSMRSLPA